MISLRGVADRLTRRVPSTYRVEGDALSIDGATRVAVVAQYSPTTTLSRSFQTLVEALTLHGYYVIVSSTTPGAGELVWPSGRPARVTVLRRPNVGYDFGSWSVPIKTLAEVRRAPYVLTVNDSLVGPFADIGPLIHDFESSKEKVWGAVRSHQFAPHLQSYFVGYRDGVLDHAPLRAFWSGISVQGTKLDVIWKYEIGLSQLLDRAHIGTDASFDGLDVVGTGINPSIIGWRTLLDRGFPFVKRQLLTEPDVAPDSADIPAHIEKLYTTEVKTWL